MLLLLLPLPLLLPGGRLCSRQGKRCCCRCWVGRLCRRCSSLLLPLLLGLPLASNRLALAARGLAGSCCCRRRQPFLTLGLGGRCRSQLPCCCGGGSNVLSRLAIFHLCCRSRAFQRATGAGSSARRRCIRRGCCGRLSGAAGSQQLRACCLGGRHFGGCSAFLAPATRHGDQLVAKPGHQRLVLLVLLALLCCRCCRWRRHSRGWRR